MNNSPLVSVIIPTYNREDTLSNAIKSAIQQTYKNIEIIVVDDGSTDGTMALIDTYFPEVLYIRKTNGGQASARNIGLQQTRGKYIASLDSDDIWNETFLEKLVSKLENDNLDFVFANWKQEQEDASFVDYLLDVYLYLPPSLPKGPNIWVELTYEILKEVYLEGCPSPSSSLLIRASLLKKMRWNEEMKIADDWCMLLDIIFNNEAKVAYTTEKLWQKNINCGNICDGRNRLEVLKLLDIKDRSIFINRYSYLMTAKEIEVMKTKYVNALLMVSNESLQIHKDFKTSFKYLVKAMTECPKITLNLIVQILSKRFQKMKLLN